MVSERTCIFIRQVVSMLWPITENVHTIRYKIKLKRFNLIYGCTVVWWLAPSPHSERVPGSTPGWGLSVWSLHVLPVYAWVLSEYSGFLPPSKNMHVSLIGVCKIVLRSVCVVVCLICLCVALWWTGNLSRVFLADDRWHRLQAPRDLTDGLSGYRKWMDNLS